ncbi:MAG: DNA-protecting protein DprA [Planctomycetes bacterium]|nr:DNA-protecting protein DprA [Planctomycetota bacterium]
MTSLEDALTLSIAFGTKNGLHPHGAPPLLDPTRRMEDWFEMDASQLVAARVPPAQRRRLLASTSRDEARRILDRTGEGAWLWRGHAQWPEVLEHVPDPPFALAFAGDPGLLREPGVAVVGPRAATPYGLHAAQCFASALALSRICVTSGLARGVDAMAHRSAICAEAPTLAILGSSLDRVYPSEHEDLANELLEHGGLLLSEAPPGTEARPALFPRRNRLLAALSQCILVVEATRRSGALLTAEWALCYDRPIFAVPGAWSSPQSEGCHRLIRDGATLTDSPDSLIADLGLQKGEARPAARLAHADQVAVVEALRRRPRPFDALLSEIGLERARLMIVLRELEVTGLIERDAGDGYRLRMTST